MENLMPIQLGRKLLVIGAVCIAIAPCEPAFADDMDSIKSLKDMSTMEGLSSMKEKIVKGAYSKEVQSDGMLVKMDENQNHVVTSAEYMNYFGEVFDALDTNQDNSIDAKEWVDNKNNNLTMLTEICRRELRLKVTMETIDTDNDQIVSRDEFIDFHQEIFEKMAKKSKGRDLIRY
jgi:hypothetical protein